jgi:glycosyltransferase involved in cell wall biosynthesis
MVVLEAMACGTPVVATRCGGPDGVIADGLDGFLVDRGDARAMADRIVRLVSDPGLRDAMGACARATIEERYSEEVAGARFEQVWETLLDDTRNRRVR